MDWGRRAPTVPAPRTCDSSGQPHHDDMASLRALECLVADSGSITQAGLLPHLSQPAVYHQLAAREREARTILLRREAREVISTPAGRDTVAGARRAVEAAAWAVGAARAVGEGSGGSLRLSCAQSLVAVLVPVEREWHHPHLDVVITLIECTSLEQLHSFLDSDEVDVLLRPAPAPDRFTSTAVGDEEVVLVTPIDHPLASSPWCACRTSTAHG